jgi:hypothetical protein
LGRLNAISATPFLNKVMATVSSLGTDIVNRKKKKKKKKDIKIRAGSCPFL